MVCSGIELTPWNVLGVLFLGVLILYVYCRVAAAAFFRSFEEWWSDWISKDDENNDDRED